MSEHTQANDFHRLKRISFLGSSRPIVMQNENGPCPLISIGAAPLTLGPCPVTVFLHPAPCARGHGGAVGERQKRTKGNGRATDSNTLFL